MLDNFKEFIKENLGLIFGVVTISLCINIVTLFPAIGAKVSEIILIIPLLFNIFPYPFNWLLFIPFVIAMIGCVLRVLNMIGNQLKNIFKIG